MDIDKIDNLRKTFGKYFSSVEKNFLDRQVDCNTLEEKKVTIGNEEFKYYYLPIVPTIKKILSNPIAMK